MRELVIKMSISLDGFVCGPKGELDWIPDEDDASSEEWTLESLRETALHVVGANTYGEMANYWPTSDGAFAESMNSIPKVVFSRSGQFKRGSWGEPQVATDLRDIQQLKRQGTGVLLAHGGAMFAQELVAAGLVDEYRLLVHPVAIGNGKPLFSRVASPLNLRLVRSITFDSGAIACVYR